MIIFAIYFLLLCFLIYKNGFFGIFKDDKLNPKFYLTAFCVKCLGIIFFYFIYIRFYGGIMNCDTAHFYNDSKVFNDISKWNFVEFLKILFGFQDDKRDTEVFKYFLQHTGVWDKNPEEFLYNDNRIIIRLNALIHFISFNNYSVHALITCFLSFIGIQWIYKAFKFLFPGKEISLFLVWVLFPGLWFWTAGVLKEGPALFLIGALLISLKRVFGDRSYTIKNIVMLIITVMFSFLLKLYVLLPVLFLSVLYFVIISSKKIKLKSAVYLASFIILVITGNSILKIAFNRDVVSLLAKRQCIFLSVSKGGIFLENEKYFVRLPYDSCLLKPNTISKAYEKFYIKKGASYMYWTRFSNDTLFCTNNSDTLTEYHLGYYFSPAKATLNVKPMLNNYVSFFSYIPEALYITLFKPFFYDARNTLDYVASFENLIILAAFIFIIFAAIKNGFKNPALIYFLSVAFSVLIIIGISSPNLGAMERYRALVIPFILMGALLSMSSAKFEQNKLSSFFKNNTANEN